MDSTSIFRILYIADYSQAETAINQMQARITQQEATIRKLSSAQAVTTQQTGQMGVAMDKTGIAIQNVEKVSKDIPAHLNRMHAGFGQMVISGLKWAAVFTVIYSAIRSVIGAVGELIGAVIKLDQSLADIASVTQETGAQLDNILKVFRKEILTYASDSRESITDIARSIYLLETAGLSAEEALSGFEHVMDTVTATMGKQEEVTQLMAGLYNTLAANMEGATTAEEKFKRMADVLAYTVNRDQVLIGELTAGLRYLAPEGLATSDSFEELVLTIGFLNTHMLKGSKAGMSMVQFLQQTVKNADKLAQVFGVTFDPEKPVNFLKTIESIHSALQNTTKLTFEQRAAIADIYQTRSARPLLPLLQDWDKLQAHIKNGIVNAVDFAHAMKEIRMSSIESRAKEAGNSIKNMWLTLSEAAIPARSIADSLKDISDAIDKANKAAEILGLTFRWLAEERERAFPTPGNLISQVLGGLASRMGFDIGQEVDLVTFITQELEKAKGAEKGISHEMKQQMDYLKAISPLQEKQTKFLTDQAKLAEDRLSFELKLVDMALEQELSIRSKLGESEIDIARARIDALEAMASMMSQEDLVVQLTKARYDLETAITDEMLRQKSAIAGNLDILEQLLQVRGGMGIGRGEAAGELIEFTLGKRKFEDLGREAQKLFPEFFPQQAREQDITEKLRRAGFITDVSGLAGRRGGSAEGLVTQAEAIAKEVAAITIQQKVDNEINIGGVTIAVQPGMTAEQIGLLAQKAIEKAYREKESKISELTNRNISDYK